MRRFILTLVVVTLFGVHSAALAQSMHTTSALATAADRQFDWAEHRAYITGNVPGQTERVFVGSAVILDPWNVLVSGHQMFQNSAGGYTTNIQVGRGSNYLTEPGATFDVANVVINEGWSGGSSFGQAVDLALMHLATPITDVSSLTIGSAQLGQQLVGVGYGRPATPSGYLPVDGQARAINLYVDRFGLGGTVSTDYFGSRFMPMSMRSDPLTGGGTPGNSGSGVFNSNGELVGLMAGVAGPPPGYFYDTFALRLDLYEPWIYSNMKVVPSPPVIPVFAAVAVFTACSRRRLDTFKVPVC